MSRAKINGKSMTIRQIAAELSLSYSAVHKAYHSGMKKLRRLDWNSAQELSQAMELGRQKRVPIEVKVQCR